MKNDKCTEDERQKKREAIGDIGLLIALIATAGWIGWGASLSVEEFIKEENSKKVESIYGSKISAEYNFLPSTDSCLGPERNSDSLSIDSLMYPPKKQTDR